MDTSNTPYDYGSAIIPRIMASKSATGCIAGSPTGVAGDSDADDEGIRNCGCRTGTRASAKYRQKEDTKIERSTGDSAYCAAVGKSNYVETNSGAAPWAPAKYGIVKLLLLLTTQLPLVKAFPAAVINHYGYSGMGHVSGDVAYRRESSYSEDPAGFWVNMSISAALVLLGGVFAGLTLGLMGQDEVYLHVMKVSGEPHERKAASKVLSLLSHGKHWVLVTLLLSNVITNETLPIVLDRCLGGGWPAVVSSSAAIVVFGEIIPQSVSVRYGLNVGAVFAPFVLALMYVMYPIAYPIALLLDKILGEDHGTMYKRAGLKTLVTLHKSMGVERLNEDEVTIISAVLDLKEKPVGDIMTPMEDVFVLSADTILDEPTMEMILHTGFNRIPIHVPDDPQNFIGMLLVRILITYDPEDALPISSFPLATLPETAPGTTCLNILNFFQEGKSHMVVVSENPGEPSGALGVVTLEDVIEELIGEEIIDESDVYVDVHKAIRRAQPGPFAKGQFSNPFSKRNSTGSITAPIAPQLERALMSALGDSQRISGSQAARQLKLGPSNKATAPLVTHIPNITVKNLSHNVQPNGTLRTADVPDGVANDDPQKTPVLVRTEEGAIQEALMADADRRETALANPGDLGYGDASASLLDLPETRTYRTGGIVESVVNVSGISKIVIGDEESANRRSRRGSSTSGKSSRANSNSSRDDLRPLLSRTFD